MENTYIWTFYQMLQPFSSYFRADVAPTFFALALAWVATTRKKRTSNFARTLGPNTPRHLATYYRFFANSKWCIDHLGIALFLLSTPLMGATNVIRICIDDTLLKHRGDSIFGASIFRDAVLSTKKNVVTRWGLNWIVLSLALPHPLFPGQFISIPLMARLFLTKKWCEKVNATYATPSELAKEMVLKLILFTPKSLHWRLVGDGAYGNKTVLNLASKSISFTSRIRYDAVIQRPLEGRPYIGGRRPTYGFDYPRPYQIADSEEFRNATKTITFQSYQGKEQTREVIDLQGTWRKVTRLQKLRFVILKSNGKENTVYLVTTDLTSPVEEILRDFISRWSIEVCFFEAKQFMGVEHSQVWCQKAVNRMAPFGFWLMGMIKVWYLRHHDKLPDIRIQTAWYQAEGRVPFVQMVGFLRFFLLQFLLSKEAQGSELFSIFGLEEDLEKRKEWLLRLVCGC